MDNRITWVGMDVHKESIVVAAISHDSDSATARSEIPNTDTGIHRLVKRLREMGDVRCAYEAGPCGYELRRFLASQEIPCDVVAPSLIPKKPGDRVETDRRDAEKLARLHRMSAFPRRLRKPFETWCAPGRTLKRMHSDDATGSRNFCCAMEDVTRGSRGRRSTGIGSAPRNLRTTMRKLSSPSILQPWNRNWNGSSVSM